VTHLQELTELKIRGQLKITKEGHVRKLLLGIKSLHNVFGEDRLMFSSQDIVDGLASEPLPAEQYEMWKELVDGCLSPSVYKYQMVCLENSLLYCISLVLSIAFQDYR
jgi:hypothetical protein